MPRYSVYTTRWDDPHIIEEIVPAQGLAFSMPLSDHGDASFTARVEPGRSSWRSSITPPMSGILIARDGVPVWQGWVADEKENEGRSFTFTAKEWGAYFTRVPAISHTYTYINNHDIIRAVYAAAAAVAGQDIGLTITAGTYGFPASLAIPKWDTRTVDDTLQDLANRHNGIEWYFGTAGTLDAPVRTLVLGTRLGLTAPNATLEFVEQTDGQWGGNVLSKARARNIANASTVAVAVDGGAEVAQVRRSATATTLLNAGWPRMTKVTTYSDPLTASALQDHASEDLRLVAGVATGYALSTLDDEPDWTSVPRGSSVAVVLDTDVYGGQRPVSFTSRLLKTTVSVPDDGPAVVQWDVVDRLEVT